MKIATAYYDSNNTLVLPDFVVPPVFQEDRITTDVGFWHRYYTSFDDPYTRAIALQSLCDELKYFETKPFDVEMTVTYPGRDRDWVAAAKKRGMPVPDPNEASYNLSVTYVVEDAEHTPFFRTRAPEYVDTTFRMPHDPVVQAFATKHGIEPLDFADRQRQKLAYAEFKDSIDHQQLNPARSGADQDARLPLYIETDEYGNPLEMGVEIDRVDIDDVLGTPVRTRAHSYSTDGSGRMIQKPARLANLAPKGYDPATGRKITEGAGKRAAGGKDEIVLSLF